MKLFMQTVLAAAVLAPLMVGCAADDTAQTGDDSEVVASIADLANKVTVLPDRLEFDADATAKLESLGVLAKIDAFESAADKKAVEPVFLVGNRQAQATNEDGSLKDDARNRTGYLRRALSWKKEGGKAIIQTEAASVAEAIEEIKKNGQVGITTKALAPLAANGEDVATGFGNSDRTWKFTFGAESGFTPIDLSGRELVRKSLLTGGSAKVMLTKGKITIKPTIDAHLLVSRFIPQNGSAVLNAEVQGELQFDATTDGAFEIFGGQTLYKKSFGREVAGLPLTMAVEVKWDCGIGATGKAAAMLGATARGSVRAGAEFQGFNIKGIMERPTYELKALGPTLDSNVKVNGVCHLVSTVALQVFDSSGPDVSVDLYAQLAADASGTQAGGQGAATLSAGVEAKVGGSLRPFGFKIADISAPPFKFERKVFDGNITLGKK